jgi:hypothetical protein
MSDTYTAENGRKAARPAPTKVLVELVAHDGDNTFVAIHNSKRVVVTLTADETGMALKALAAFTKPTAARLAVVATVTPDQIDTY